MKPETIKMGKRGTVVIPNHMRKAMNLEEGDLLIAEMREDGLMLLPAVAVPVEHYNHRQKAALLLNNAVDAEDYRNARKEVEKLGVDPDSVPHHAPPGA